MEEKHKDHDRLVQRMLALQSILSKFGIEEDFSEDDIQREYSRLPKDSEDFLDFSDAKPPETPAEEPDYYEFDLGFEPFNPNEEADKVVQETLAEAKPVQETTPPPMLSPEVPQPVLGMPSPLAKKKELPMPPMGVIPPKEGATSW